MRRFLLPLALFLVLAGFLAVGLKLDPRYVVKLKEGDRIDGADAVVAAFASQFAASGFITYVRTTTSIEITDDGQRAAELGRWTGNWKDGGEMSGIYMATWRNNRGQWLLERELYITLQG